MNYIIPIGGTGVRVMKAIIYLAMTGCFEGQKFKVMCVDSDESNGDIKRLEDIIGAYKKLDNYNIFPEIIPADVDKATDKSLVWSPLASDEINSKSRMQDMVGESLMGDKAKDIFRFLYTKGEREKILEGGFYGHTSIGSYFMSKQVKDGNEYTAAWKSFFDGINEKKDKIFIIGSIFGGTGASGVPTIARIIKETELTENVPIAAIFVQPYFKPTTNTEDEINDLEIDWNTFSAKTKTALSYYSEQKFNDIFKIMYFIGEDPDKFMVVDNNDCGNKQVNKANAIELFAATALLDFINRNVDDIQFTTRFMMRELKPDGVRTFISKEMLNIQKQNVFEKITKFLKFSILFVRYYYTLIVTNEMDKGFAYRNIEPEMAEKMRKLCLSYIEWIRELIVNTDDNGHVDYNKPNENIEWFRSDLGELFSEESLGKKPVGFGPFKTYKFIYSQLDCMAEMFQSDMESLKGEEIMDRLSDLNGKGGLNELIHDFFEICM